MNISQKKISIILAGIILLSASTVLAQFAGGSGTETDPWQVATAEQLNNVRDYLSQHFIQTADINLGVAPWNQGEGWVPIGRYSPHFTGTYNGNSFTISGLYINRTNEVYIGLFGTCNGAKISNLNLLNTDVTGNQYTGALVGWNDYNSKIIACSSDGIVVGASFYTGGLVGWNGNSSELIACSTDGSVEGAEYDTGGLVGLNYEFSEIIACHSNASVIGGDLAGGLVGQCVRSSVLASFSTGSVNSTGIAGGLIGYIDYLSLVADSYSRSSVTGNGGVGGLIGKVSMSTVIKSYCTGLVSGSSSGGVIGTILYSSTISSNYWNLQSSNQSSSAGGGGPRSTEEMTFPYAANTYLNWDFERVWVSDADHSQNDGYPYLTYALDYQSPVAVTPGGSGTEAAPYLIGSLENLFWIAEDSSRWDKYYLQTSDIDASQTYSWSYRGWIPIGNSTVMFTGSYDGGGHEISDIYMNRLNESNIGFIGYSYGGRIRNLIVSDISVAGWDNTGALVGANEASGTIDNCQVTGRVFGSSSNTGGLAGYNNGATISESFSRASVSGNYKVGGLVGWNNGNARISDCFSTGLVSGYETGGLIGANYSSTVSNSYWNTQTSGQSGSSGGEGRTTTEMTWPYPVYSYLNWNWADWIPDPAHSVNEGYPYLYFHINDYTEIPGITLAPAPADASLNITGNTILSWQGQVNETYTNLFTGFKLWLGTDNPPTNIVNGIDIGRVYSYDPDPDLADNTTYYWKLVPYNPVGDAQNCPVWNFRTYNPNPDLLYPNGGELWMFNTTRQIRWASNAPPLVNLYLSFDNGSVWNSIGTVDGTSGIYHYQVPSQSSPTCRLKITNAADETLQDLSDATFSISSSTTLPKLTLNYPSAANIHMRVGQGVSITWTRQNVSSVALDYSTDNGLNWSEIVSGLNANSYAWTVPNLTSSTARIRVRSQQNQDVGDTSDNAFRVCTVNLISPNGGELMTGDHTGSRKYLITWSTAAVDNLKLEYSSNGGTNWSTITNSIPANPTHYLWTIPSSPTESGLIRISSTANSSINDVSDLVFEIQNPIRIMNANGGGFVTNTAVFNLRWLIQDLEPDRLLYWEYSANNSSWTRINSTPVPVSDNYMDWYVDTGLQSSMWLRAIEHGSNYIVAKSASSFRVTDKQLQLLSPGTAEILGVDSYQNITWHAVGCTNLNIDYSIDFGQSWIPIAVSIPASQFSYLWHVPNTPSNQCRIRLRDATYSYMWVESEAEFTIYPYDFEAAFSASPTIGYADLAVQFTDESVGIVSAWDWDFDADGICDSSLQDPLWIFRTPGFHTVTLTISYNGISNSVTRQNYIYVYPMQADFSASQASGYLPLSVQFTDLTESDVTQWQWDFDSDGLIDSEAENPVWTYIFPGTYTVSHWVSNGLDSDSEIKEDYITVSLDPAHTLYVPSQYLTIQAAIDASSSGDYIIIANGIYYENLLIEGKTITLASYYFIDGDSTHISNTIIDGSNALNPDQASTITILPGSGRPNTTPHISGFTIRGGSGRRVVQNQGDSIIEKRVGGGIYTRQANPIFSYNKIEDNDADDEGGGSYAFQSLPNHGGMVDPAIGLYNPGANYFANNHADIGADIYIDGITQRDPIKLQNCSFAVISVSDTTVSNYWVNSSAALSFSGSTGREVALSTDLYVATDGSDTLNTGLSPASPFKTIDHALSRIYTTEGSPLTIHIASGSYSPSLTGEKFPLQMVKYVSLQGAGRDETYLDAEGSADLPRRVLNLDNVAGVNISDLTLMNGFVTTVKNYNGGGIGIINSNCSLSNLLLAGSASAGNGAGLYAFQSSVIADSISLQYNAALGSGGGICANASDLQITGANISHNSANKNGAGIFADGGLLSLSESEISNNQATGYQSKGGGISLSNTTAALISNNRIQANNSDLGAGIYLQSNQNLRLDRNRISNNLADFSGGGLFVNTTTGLFTNNLISNNTATQRGGGLYCYSAPLISSNTIASNQAGIEGGGIYLNGASPVLTNNIVWGNVRSNPEIPNQFYLYAETSDPDISYCDIQGGSTGITHSPGTIYSGNYTNNLDSAPLFTDPPEGAGNHFIAGEAAFSLQTSSPCVDHGDPVTDASDYPMDLTGYNRIANNRVDIGAYETAHFNGAVITASASLINFGRVDVNGLPATSTLTIFNNGNQDLLITNISLESSDPDFSFQISGRNHLILPGSSLNLELIFAPSLGGERLNKLLIHNNSLNSSIFSVDLVGTGIDAGTSYPSNIQVQIQGNDVQLSWNPVISDPQGNPYNPSGYLVFGSEQANSPIEDYLLISYTEQAEFIHRQVARVKNRMFYIIISIDEGTRARIIPLLENQQRVDPLSWKEIKKLIP